MKPGTCTRSLLPPQFRIRFFPFLLACRLVSAGHGHGRQELWAAGEVSTFPRATLDHSSFTSLTELTSGPVSNTVPENSNPKTDGLKSGFRKAQHRAVKKTGQHASPSAFWNLDGLGANHPLSPAPNLYPPHTYTQLARSVRAWYPKHSGTPCKATADPSSATEPQETQGPKGAFAPSLRLGPLRHPNSHIHHTVFHSHISSAGPGGPLLCCWPSPLTPPTLPKVVTIISSRAARGRKN